MNQTETGTYRIVVDTSKQELHLFADGQRMKTYAISTGKNGIGELSGSEKTPRGQHYIRAKIGAGKPANTVFVGRRDTGEVFSETLRETHPDRDWILTRIMWLCGCEPGFNRGGNVDTMRRYIYIHGSPDADEMGKPGSHGCIKMKNQDVVELFDLVPAGTTVTIDEGS